MLIGASAATLLPSAEIMVGGGMVRLGDVARVSGVAPEARERLAGRIIATLPPGRDRVTLSRRALAALVRRAVPGLAVAGDDRGPVVILRREPMPRPMATGCLATSRPVSSGETLGPADAAPVPCRPQHAAAAVAFDPAQAVTRASANLPAGAYLGRIRLSEPSGVGRGDALTMASRVGPVRIERRVVALQPGRPGGRLFVRTDDGEVIAADLALGEAEAAE